MSGQRSTIRRPFAFSLACAVILTLAVPFGGIAVADTDNTLVPLDVEAETATNTVGSTHTLTATVSNGNAGAEIDFEIDCMSNCASAIYTRVGTTGAPDTVHTGGPVSAFDAGVDGDQVSPTADDTRVTPEMSCTTTSNFPDSGRAGCQVVYSRSNTGEELIAGWVDDNKANEENDSDLTEGRAEAGLPGTITEGGNGDDTDVVQKNWFADIVATAAIDCKDATGTTAAEFDTETNQAGQSETYTCSVFNDNGSGLGATASNAVQEGSEPGISAVVIDVEISGANDPDNLGFTNGSNLLVDNNSVCTTGSDGTCTVTITPSKNETGTATICFWTDADNDTAFDPTGADANDGGGCGEAVTGAEATSLRADVVTKTWASPTATRLDASPEVSNNATTTSHTITVRVTDQFGAVSPGVPVDVTITAGRNVALGLICNDVLTNSSGQATCTYTDAGSATTSGQDTIRVNRDGVVDATEPRNEVATPGTTAEPDLTDVVTKFWTVGGPPAAGSLFLDMDLSDANCNDPNDNADSAEVGSFNPICGIVQTIAPATAIPGKSIALTYSGPGQLALDLDGDGILDEGEGLGKSATITSDEGGRWDISLFSTQTASAAAGNAATVTATADSLSDSGTKTWTTPSLGVVAAGGGRNIDCLPATGANRPGTTHLVTCTVSDRYGNGVSGVSVTPGETGPGRSTPATAATTGVAGTVEFVLSTAENETGTQTFTAEITADFGETDTASDIDDPCDQPEGRVIAPEPGTTTTQTGQTDAPAGNCEDTVTKTWTTEPLAECEDGIDNDGDGLIDFPADPGCANSEDDDEGFVPRACQNRGPTANVIIGTSGADVLNGTGGRDIICGGGGDDVISGRGGNDLIVGNGGNDTIAGGGGKDNLAGNAGSDSLSGGRGNDAVKGNNGNDAIKGNNGIDNLSGGGGSDTLQGGDKQDILKGGDGNDTLRGGKGDDALDGGPGNDQCFGNAGNDSVRRCE